MVVGPDSQSRWGQLKKNIILRKYYGKEETGHPHLINPVVIVHEKNEAHCTVCSVQCT